MNAYTTEELQTRPEFDLEDFMNFVHESKISSEALEHFLGKWETWAKTIRAVQIKSGKNSWVAIWLPEEVEKEIDNTWETSPTEGFLFNGLAQYMCMNLVEQLIPEAAGGGCAPSPELALPLSRALSALGLSVSGDESHLARRYAILTHYPFRGGCEICSLQENCPKGSVGHEYAQVVLPGYERGVEEQDHGA